MSTKIDITNLNQEEIDEILNKLSIKSMLCDYKLTADFCVKYILTTDDYASCVEDTYYCDYEILILQKHITQEELDIAYNNYYKNNSSNE
jgi:hypothetical protein